MASIEKLSISGIRSFDPNTSNKQEIVFRKPLTIILGKNGAGKTTIIEALLNACTGKMPPGASGPEKTSFVYDPKVVGESVVKGQIRLQFNSRTDKPMLVLRTFQVAATKTKSTFTTLDSSIAEKDETGNIQSASVRAQDLDSLVPEHLGVSPAVLEHVVFCHQEDGNWPLGAPAEVKKKFDDIFASTRYVAALDKLRDKAKQFRSQLKDQEAFLITFREHREQAKQLQSDVENKEEALRLTRLRSRELDPRLEQLRAAMAGLDGVAHNAEALRRESDILNGKIEEKQRTLARLGVQQPKESLGQLKDMMGDFEAHMRQAQEELRIKQGKSAAVESAARQAEQDLSSARNAVALLQSQETQHKKQLEDLQKVVRSITNEFVAGDDTIDERAIVRVEEQLISAVDEARRALEATVSEFTRRIRERTDERDTINRTMDADGKERELKESHAQRLATRIQQARAALPKASDEEVQRLRGELKTAENKASAARKARENATHQKEVEAAQKELSAKNERLAELRRLMAEQSSEREETMRLQQLRKQVEEKEEQLQGSLNTNLIPMLKAAGHAPNSATLKAANASAEGFKKQKTVAMAAIVEKMQNAEMDLRSSKDALETKQAAFLEADRDLNQQLSVCRSVLGEDAAIDDFAAKLAAAEVEHMKHCTRAASIESMASCYDTFVATAKKESVCDVCRRGLTGAALADFLKLQEERRSETPTQLAASKADVSKAAKQLERLRSIEGAVRDALKLQAEVPALRAAVKKLTDRVSEAEDLVASTASTRAELQKQVDQAQRVMEIAQRANAQQEDVIALQRDVKRLEEKLATAAKGSKKQTFEELQAKHDGLMTESVNLNERLQALQQSSNSAGDLEIEQAVLARRHELNDAESRLQQREQAEAAIKDMVDDATRCQARVKEITDRRADLAKKLDASNATVESLEKDRQTTTRAKETDIAEALERRRVFDSAAGSVKEFIGGGHSAKLRETNKVVASAEAAHAKAREEMDTLRKETLKLQKALDEQHRRRGDLTAALQFRELEEEMLRDRASLEAAEKNLGKLQGDRIRDVRSALDADSANLPLPALRDKLRAMVGEIERSRAQNDGKVETMLQDIANLKGQLAKEKFKDIGTRYMSTFIKVQTIELAIQDIDKYYKALERAVASYHQEKITQINAIIAELWRHTYRGSDIDAVQIASEAENQSVSEGRRSFRYRVVMRRGETSLDMRGRCSAGQKVLASVIIRMALSEAFCCDCGILALDEPTTNLDEDNAKALAESLKELINARRNVRHFQLVVITHDEQFVRALGAKQRDSFYFVSKDREGAFSVISERRYDELFA